MIAALLLAADLSWIPGNAGPAERPLTAGPVTGEVRLDIAYHYDLHGPADDTISGSSEVFRHGELQLTHLGLGGDLLYQGVIARVMLQLGLYSTTTPRNDSSPSRGQWNLADAYRYLSEAYAGYHVGNVNLEAGLFMSYVGLWSYYGFDNWTYQPSYVSSNTPWFFNGARAQIFLDDGKLKLEPWLVNGWQSYGRFGSAPGAGGQVQWRPTDWFGLTLNQYVGADTLGVPDRKRVHLDDSMMVKWSDATALWTRAASSLTLDAGCEWGGGVRCGSQYFLGFMAYQRFWFGRFGVTAGGGGMINPGRYLVLLPPINGATAVSGTPYFTQNPGDRFGAWDFQLSADFSPVPYLTFRVEYNHRSANVPYFSGPGGVTPPGGNQGPPGSDVPGWAPDLVQAENRLTTALLVKL